MQPLVQTLILAKFSLPLTPHLSHRVGVGHQAGLTAVWQASHMSQLMTCDLWVFGEMGVQ